MKKFKLKKLALVLTVIITMLMFTIFASAASTKKMLEAYYGVTIQYNGNVLTSTTQPFIVNGTTYVPLRMIMDSFGDKSVQWDGANQRVTISNSTSNMEQVYMQQILERNKQIEELNAQIATLKSDNEYLRETINNPEIDINDLEEDLDDKYEDYNDKDISISLDGDNKKIELTVKIDKDEWDDFSQSSKESFLDKVCEDIWDEAEDAEIEGEIKDGSTVLDSFTVKAGKDVELVDFSDTLSDFEETLENKFDDDWDDEDISLKLYLSGDEEDIQFEIRLSLTTYEDEWDDLTDNKLKSLMDDIYDELDDEYPDADIDGVVYDTVSKKNIATYNGSTLTRD